MTDRGLFDLTDDDLSSYDATTLTFAVFDVSFTPLSSLTNISSATGEIDTGDAAGYARQTETVTWDATARRLTLDAPVSFDLAGGTPALVLTVTATGVPVAWKAVTAAPGYDGWLFAPTAIAGYNDELAVTEELADHETRIGVVEARQVLPDPSGGSAGDTVARNTAGDGFELVTPSGGGGGTPDAHAASHEDGGSDELALDASQITTGVFASARLPIKAAVLAANATKTSDTALSALTGLSVAMLSGETWVIDFTIYVASASNVPDLDLALDGPSGSTVTLGAIASRGDTLIQYFVPVSGIGTRLYTQVAGVAGGVDYNVTRVRATITAASDGTAQLQFSQSVSNALATTVRAGSSMIAVRA